MSNRVEVELNGQTSLFTYSESAGVWVGEVNVDRVKLTLEIFCEFRSEDVQKLVQFLSVGNQIAGRVDKAKQLLRSYLEIVRFGISSYPEHYHFELTGIFYYGKINGVFERAWHYALLFRLHEAGFVETTDPYGLYLAEFENGHLKGIKRQQV